MSLTEKKAILGLMGLSLFGGVVLLLKGNKNSSLTRGTTIYK